MVSVLGNIHGTAGRVSEAKSILAELRDVSLRLAALTGQKHVRGRITA